MSYGIVRKHHIHTFHHRYINKTRQRYTLGAVSSLHEQKTELRMYTPWVRFKPTTCCALSKIVLCWTCFDISYIRMFEYKSNYVCSVPPLSWSPRSWWLSVSPGRCKRPLPKWTRPGYNYLSRTCLLRQWPLAASTLHTLFWSQNVSHRSYAIICFLVQQSTLWRTCGWEFLLQLSSSGIDSMHIPRRIPCKVEMGFSGCTADQYKNWVTLYSIPCLHSLLDHH